MALHQSSSVLCLVTALLAVATGAQAFRTPTGHAAEPAAEASNSRSARHAEAHIAAEFKPGPEYRAYTEMDELTEYTGYRKASTGSKGSADKPKGPSKPVHNPFLDDDLDEDSKPKYGHGAQPYPEPRPDHEPADDRQYKDRPWIRGSEQYKDDQLQPWIRGSGKDEEYKEEYQPYEAPPAQQQHPYDKEGSYDKPSYESPQERYADYVKAPYDKPSYNKPSHDKPSYNKAYSDEPSYGREDYKPYSPHETTAYNPKERPYDREGPDSYRRDSRDDSYGGYKDDSYNTPDSYDSGYHGEPKARICLQEQSRVETPDTTGQTGQNMDMVSKKYMSKFQCCTPADTPDACLEGNKTDSPYSYYSKYLPGFRSDSLLDTYLAPTVAATCIWQYTNTLCPPHLLKTCLGGGKLTCSLPGDAAKECGAPSRKFQFVAEGWFVGVEALSCAQYYDPSAATGTAGRKLMTDPAPAAAPATAPAAAQSTVPATAPTADSASAQATAQAAEPATARATTQAAVTAQGGLFSGVAWKFQGTIKLVRREYGFEEGRGVVEFVAAFGQPTSGFAIGGRRSGRNLLAEAPKSDDKAAAPAAAIAPAATVPAAAALSAVPSKSSAQAPAAAAAPAPSSVSTPAATPASPKASAQAPATGTTSTQTQTAAPAAAGSPTKVQSGGAYFVDDEAPYAPYGPYDSYEPDLPIVKGGSLHITLFDDYSDRDSHGY